MQSQQLTPDNFLGLFRAAFKGADSSSDNGSKKGVLEKLEFAGDDESPENTIYIPFSWTKNGERNRGYLIGDYSNNKIYGLETDKGFSLSSKGAKSLLESLDKDNNATFSNPKEVMPFYFADDDSANETKSNAMSYLLSKGTPFGVSVDSMIDKGVASEKLKDNFISTFVKNLRKAYNKGKSDEEVLRWALDFGKEQFPNLYNESENQNQQQSQPFMQLSRSNNVVSNLFKRKS